MYVWYRRKQGTMHSATLHSLQLYMVLFLPFRFLKLHTEQLSCVGFPAEDISFLSGKCLSASLAGGGRYCLSGFGFSSQYLSSNSFAKVLYLSTITGLRISSHPPTASLDRLFLDVISSPWIVLIIVTSRLSCHWRAIVI